MAFDASSDVPLVDRPPGSARLYLRQATATDHEAVDLAYAAFDLQKVSSYRAFLTAQLACVSCLEEALTEAGAAQIFEQWPNCLRANLAAADLGALGAREQVMLPSLAAPEFLTEAEVLGAIYVLEGSRFGGNVLAKRLPRGMPARFLQAGADTAAWRSLLMALDFYVSTDAALSSAAHSAKAVFSAFETAARLTLEPSLAP